MCLKSYNKRQLRVTEAKEQREGRGQIRRKEETDRTATFVPRTLGESPEREKEPSGQRKEATRLPAEEGSGQGRWRPGLNGNGGSVTMEKGAGSPGSNLSVRGKEGSQITGAGCVHAHSQLD